MYWKKTAFFIKIRVLFLARKLVFLGGIFVNFDNERMRSPLYLNALPPPPPPPPPPGLNAYSLYFSSALLLLHWLAYTKFILHVRTFYLGTH